MISLVNPDKFQAMIMSYDKKRKQICLNKNNSIIISSVDSVTRLGIETNSKLNSEKHVSTIISFDIFLSRQYGLFCKAFDCIMHDLLIAKLQAYGFDNYSLNFVCNYLAGREQKIKIVHG